MVKSVFRKSFTCFLGIFITAFASNALAQKDENVDVNLSVITLNSSIRDLKYMSADSVQEFNAFKGVRSDRFRYVGGPILEFFREKPPEQGQTESLKDIVGKVQIPAMNGDYLLLFSRNPGDEEKYQIEVISDDLAIFQAGMYRFINLSPFDIAMQIGDVRKMIPKKNFVDVASEGEEGEYQDTMMYSLTVQPGEENPKPYRAFKGSLYFSKKKRTIYVITPVEGGRAGRIRFTAIPENIN